MNADQNWKLRLAILATLVKEAPLPPGRTALMKFSYLLQTLKDVPLGYHFELYNYGPYDPTVLSDLSQATTLKAIKSKTVYHQSGYGYEYSTNEKGYSAFCAQSAADLEQYSKEIDWVLAEFGGYSASRLELISTIVFADQEMSLKRQPQSSEELCRRVKLIKPHFTDETISETIDKLAEKSLLSAEMV